MQRTDMTKLLVTRAFFILIVFSNVAQAENWTRFRGPNGTGVANGVSFPATWTEQDYAWKFELGGIGHSSPVGWEDHLYVTTGAVETGDLTLYCLSAENGSELWMKEFKGGKFGKHASNSYASATPTTDADHVYIAWSVGGKMQCAALSHDGKEAWQTDLGEFVEAHGFAASPVVIDGVVCLQVEHADGGFLAGLNTANGEILWKAERPLGKASYATPCVWIADGNRPTAISQSMTGGMQAIDVHSGAPIWEMSDAFPARTVSSPFLANEYLMIGICGGGGSGKRLVGVQLVGDSPPLEQLSLTKQLPYVPTPLAYKNLLFLWHDQGKVSCADLSAEDPSKLLWTERIGGKYFGSPILAGDKIYCLSAEGHAVVIAADEEFKLLGETDLGKPTYATPAVHQGKMYLRTESVVACLPAE